MTTPSPSLPIEVHLEVVCGTRRKRAEVHIIMGGRSGSVNGGGVVILLHNFSGFANMISITLKFTCPWA